MSDKGRERQSNFELLRILAIAFIVCFHCMYKGGFDAEKDSLFINRLVYDFMYYAGETGVNLFILISGYFLTDTVRKPRKIVLIALQTFFYLALCRVLLIALGRAEMNSWTLKDYLFPILNKKYWYVTVYVLIYLFSPYLKTLVLNLDKRRLGEILIIWFLIWSVYPTVVLNFLYGYTDLEAGQNYNRLIWLTGVYLCGAYIRIHGVPGAVKPVRRRVILLFALLCILAVHIIFGEIKNYTGRRAPVFYWQPNTVMEIMISLAVFLCFEKIRIPYNKVLNYIAGCSLGVYLLHDHPDFNSFLWRILFKNASLQDSGWFVPYLLFTVIAIFAAGILIETARKLIEKKAVEPVLRLASARIRHRMPEKTE